MSRDQLEHYLREIQLVPDRVPTFEAYPYCLPAVRNLKTLPLHRRVTFLVGENGTGKSTLLEAVAVALGLNPEGGSRDFRFGTCASYSELYKAIRLAKGILQPGDAFFLRGESFFNVASEVDRLEAELPGLIQRYGGRSLHEQSHGESFLALFQERFRGRGLYLLDEPEAALSPTRQMGFLAILHDLVCRGSQFLIATHSPIILAYPNAWIYMLDQEGIERTEYEDTEHYKLTRYFLNNVQKMVGDIIGPDDAGA